MFGFNHVIFSAVILLFLVILIVLLIRKRRKQSPSESYSSGEQLYIGNLSYRVNGFQLKEIFSQYGEIAGVRVIKNAQTGRSKGFAFVTYVNGKDAQKALSANGEAIQGRAIVVRMAKPR